MNILSLLFRRRSVPARTATVEPSARLDEEVDADLPLGCGWFDSSHELQHGLLVREHATPDTLAGELPLANWLELHLSGWRGPLPA
jgi:hypothetical protein